MRNGKGLTSEEFKKLPLMEKIIVVSFMVFVYGAAVGVVVGLPVYLAFSLKAKNEQRLKRIAERETLLYKYSWDGTDKEEELLRRVMLYSGLSPEELGRYFSKPELGRVFLENIQDFNEEKRKLWINYLNIPEEEVRKILLEKERQRDTFKSCNQRDR